MKSSSSFSQIFAKSDEYALNDAPNPDTPTRNLLTNANNSIDATTFKSSMNHHSTSSSNVNVTATTTTTGLRNKGTRTPSKPPTFSLLDSYTSGNASLGNNNNNSNNSVVNRFESLQTPTTTTTTTATAHHRPLGIAEINVTPFSGGINNIIQRDDETLFQLQQQPLMNMQTPLSTSFDPFLSLSTTTTTTTTSSSAILSSALSTSVIAYGFFLLFVSFVILLFVFLSLFVQHHTDEYANWIVVIGVNSITWNGSGSNGDDSSNKKTPLSALLLSMTRHGEVVEHLLGRGNWVFIKYARVDAVGVAVREAYVQLSVNNIVSIQPLTPQTAALFGFQQQQQQQAPNHMGALLPTEKKKKEDDANGYRPITSDEYLKPLKRTPTICSKLVEFFQSFKLV